MTDHRIEIGEDGLRWLIVTNGWSTQHADLVRSNRVDGIELNSSKGSWDSRLGFLEDVPDLRHLILIDLTTRDIQPIQQLGQLETLKLSAYATSPFDFGTLPKLKKAFIEWRKQYRNLSACALLEDLYVNRYTEHDLLVVESMPEMKRLRVGDSRTLAMLLGVTALRRLKSIGLYGLPRLRGIEQLGQLSETIEEVVIRQCRYLSGIDSLGHLHLLKRLILEDCGKIPSIRTLGSCLSLRKFLFPGDTDIVDGDLELLRKLPLTDVSFKNRRHYSLRREELSAFTP